MKTGFDSHIDSLQVSQAGIPWLARLPKPRQRPRPEPMMTYDFPLREGLLVRCTLPLNLTREDAERIERFVHALPFERTP